MVLLLLYLGPRSSDPHEITYSFGMDEFRAVVSGRVQMVSYRAFVQKHAQYLALRGSVRNLPNGNVEVVAQGYRDNLEKLLERMRKGPFMAQVNDVRVEWRDPQKQFDGFEIVY